MPDVQPGTPGTMSLGDGSTFNSSGQSLNTQAVSDVFDLKNPSGVPGVGVGANYNNQYIPPGGTTSTMPSNNPFFASTPTSSVATTSGPAQTAADNTKSNIDNSPPTVLPPAPSPTGANGAPTTYTWGDGTTGHLTPDVNGFGTAGYNSSTDPNVAAQVTAGNQIYTNQEQALKTQRDQEIARLTGENQSDQSTQNSADAALAAGSAVKLAAGGANFGDTGQSFLVGLQFAHERSMQTLQAKYDSAIQAAKDAYTNNDFAVADKETANAKNIQDAAQKRNQDYLDNVDKIQTQQRADAAQTFNEQNTINTANKENLTWARTNGLHPDAQFFASGGVIYNAADGSQVQGSTPEQLQAAGVAPDLSNVQMIQAKRTGTLGDMDDYNAGLKEAGKPPLNIMQYTDMLQKQKEAVARAGASITVAQQQFALTQAQTADIQGAIQYWTSNNMIQGNGTISSKDYKAAKIKFTSTYGAESAKAFDTAMSVFVDSSNSGGTKLDSRTGITTNLPNYKDQYGINP